MSEHLIELAPVFYIPALISKTLKRKTLQQKNKLCIPVKDSLFWGNSKTSSYHIRLPIWRNEAILIVNCYKELLGSTFHIRKSNFKYATESTCFGTKMATIWKGKKALQDQQENFPSDFFASLNNNQKERHCSKLN